jgi:hypothetical protein
MTKVNKPPVEIEANNQTITFLPATFSLEIPREEKVDDKNRPTATQTTSTSAEKEETGEDFRISVAIMDPKTGCAKYASDRKLNICNTNWFDLHKIVVKGQSIQPILNLFDAMFFLERSDDRQASIVVLMEKKRFFFVLTCYFFALTFVIFLF